MTRLRFDGRVGALGRDDRSLLLDRTTSSDPVVRGRVAEIVARVRQGGDDALRALARELDGAELESLEVPR
ncbi:MAG TPA: hypothetical protein VHM67_14350, partial [Gemmatimonadaceae bacterium]|nr:hypothetical protein [Gemmatimonadaceae bacterium]